MNLFKRLKNLITPVEKKKPRRKTVKGAKRKTKPKTRAKKKPKKTPKKPQKKTGLNKIEKKPLKKHSLKKSSRPLKKLPREKEIGIVTHYFGKISVGIIKLKSALRVGDKIHIKGAHDNFTQLTKSIQVNHKDIADAKKGDEIGIKVTQAVHENDKVYKLS